VTTEKKVLVRIFAAETTVQRLWRIGVVERLRLREVDELLDLKSAPVEDWQFWLLWERLRLHSDFRDEQWTADDAECSTVLEYHASSDVRPFALQRTPAQLSILERRCSTLGICCRMRLLSIPGIDEDERTSISQELTREPLDGAAARRLRLRMLVTPGFCDNPLANNAAEHRTNAAYCYWPPIAIVAAAMPYSSGEFACKTVVMVGAETEAHHLELQRVWHELYAEGETSWRKRMELLAAQFPVMTQRYTTGFSRNVPEHYSCSYLRERQCQ